MDQTVTLQELKVFIEKFCTDRDWDQFHSAKDLAIGASTEANELLELFRFKSDNEVLAKLGEEDFKKKMSYEMVDVLFFILRLAQKYNVDLSSAFYDKMSLNAQKYSIEKAKGSNKKYNE